MSDGKTLLNNVTLATKGIKEMNENLKLEHPEMRDHIMQLATMIDKLGQMVGTQMEKLESVNNDFEDKLESNKREILESMQEMMKTKP